MHGASSTPSRARALPESSSPALRSLLLLFPSCPGPLLEIRFLASSIQGTLVLYRLEGHKSSGLPVATRGLRSISHLEAAQEQLGLSDVL